MGRFIFEYLQFVNWSSNSGKTRTADVVHSEEPSSPKSPISSLLLRRDLMEKEADDFLDNLEIDPENTPVKNKRQDDIRQMYFNQEFLRKKSEKQSLMCEYCGKKPLRSYPVTRKEMRKMLLDVSFRPSGFNKKDGATVDHKEPRSKGGDKFDEENLAVCCHRCNATKGDMDFDSWNSLRNL